jgi:hypothetical protein
LLKESSYNRANQTETVPKDVELYTTPPKGPTFKMFFKKLNFRRKMFFSNLTMGQILNRNGESMNSRKLKVKNICQILKN